METRQTSFDVLFPVSIVIATFEYRYTVTKNNPRVTSHCPLPLNTNTSQLITAQTGRMSITIPTHTYTDTQIVTHLLSITIFDVLPITNHLKSFPCQTIHIIEYRSVSTGDSTSYRVLVLTVFELRLFFSFIAVLW